MDEPVDIWPHLPWLSEEEQRTLRACLPELEQQATRLCAAVCGAFEAQPQLAPVLSTSNGAQREAHSRDLLEQLYSASEGRWGGYEASVRKYALCTLGHKVKLGAYYDATDALRAQLLPQWLRAHAADADLLLRRIAMLQKLLDRTLEIVREEHSRTREAEIRARRVETEQALLLSERRFARLSQAGLLGILICDIHGNTKDANDTFLSMLGYSREEMLAGKMRWADLTPPEWRHLDQDAIEQLQARGFTRSWEKEYFHKSGTRLPIVVGVAMIDENECIAFVLDITERRRLEELRVRSAELEAQNRRIEESSRLKSEFLANMSHELRTPLNSIIGFADLLFDGEVPADSPKHHEFLGHILRSGRHLLQLINDVLDLAKVEAGKLEFRPEPIDLSLVAEEVVTILRSTATSKHAHVEVDIEASVKDVVLDAGRLKQVLYNYVSNALKFTPEGGRVVVRGRPAGPEFVRLEVQDTGIGIAASDLPRLFVQFQQLDSGSGKRHAGTGLGLALTRRIVEAQGGRVGVHSAPGRGSTFFAELPRHAAGRSATRPPAASSTGPDSGICMLVVEDDPTDRALLAQTLATAGHGVETAILIVDDDPAARSLMQRLLLQCGYRVECCTDGSSALALCARQRPLAVVLDLLMSGIDGFEFLARFRERPENRRTPVIVWTAKDLTLEDRTRLYSLSHGLIAKGQCQPAAVVDQLQTLLGV